MIKSLLLTAAVLMSGCVSLSIPSFWDDNQSAAIVSVRQAIENINCEEPHAPQVLTVQQKLRWFELYSESKGNQQRDVLRLVQPMKETVDDFARRSNEKQGSKTYCELKKSTMVDQARTVSRAVLGRF
jgi:cob(I)alamin adenosyltransferase